MKPFSASLAVLATTLGLYWCLLPHPASGAPAPSPDETRPKPESAQEKLRKALEQSVSLDFNSLTLDQAVVQLGERTKLQFVLDRATLQLMGMDPEDVAVNLKVDNGKLRTALRTLLSPYNLAYAVIGDTVLITTDEMALYRQMRQRVSINLDRVPLATALKQLAQDTGTNLVLDGRLNQEAKGAVTLTLDDVPLDVAVRVMAETCGLKPARIGNVLFVTTKANAVDLRGDPEGNTPPVPVRAGADDAQVFAPRPRRVPMPAFPVPAIAPPAANPIKPPPAKPVEKKEEKEEKK
jgi:hypothetical protein